MRYVRLVESIAKDWKLLALWAALTVGFNLLLGWAAAGMGSYRPLDLQFNGYRSWEAYDLLNALGPAGRAAHQDTWWLDLVFPLCYAPFTAMLLARLWNARFAPGMMLCLLPFGGALLDYLENICIGVALFTYPARHDALMDFSGLVTALKWWGFAFPSLALVGIGGGWSLGAFLERRRRGAG